LPLIRAELQRWGLPRPGPLLHDLSQVLYLPFDHDDGSYARDRSGYDNHGTIYGATLATGKIGMSRSFDGVDDYVDTPFNPHVDLGDGKPFTISAWFYIRSFPEAYACISGVYVVADERFYFQVRSADRVLFVGLGDWYSATNLAISLNTWTHGAMTYDGSRVKVYKNAGVPWDSGTIGSKVFGDDDLYIGANHAVPPGSWVDGIIDEFRIYNRVLSAAEIARLIYLRGV